MLWQSLSYQRRTKWEYYVLSDELSDQRHTWVVRCFLYVIEHRVYVVELTNEFRKLGNGELFYDVVLNQLNKQIVLIPTFNGFHAWQLNSLLLLLFGLFGSLWLLNFDLG